MHECEVLPALQQHLHLLPEVPDFSLNWLVNGLRLYIGGSSGELDVVALHIQGKEATPDV